MVSVATNMNLVCKTNIGGAVQTEPQLPFRNSDVTKERAFSSSGLDVTRNHYTVRDKIKQENIASMKTAIFI